jgi:hypothetical protein
VLRLVGIERYGQVNALAAVGVDRGEDCRMIVDAEEVLIERNLCCVLRISLVEAVAVERMPALSVDRLVLPETGIGDIADLRTVDQDAVGVAGQ